jgi:hypothetical protein
MKKYITILFLFASIVCSGTNYYVKNGGSDLADGLSDGNAWETITKVNAVWVAKSFAPGDSILFNRGDTFYGGLVAGEDGTSGNYISIGSYGSGANPIITGFTTLSDWTDEGGHVFSCSLNCGFVLNNVTVDGVQKEVGRWPDDGWYNIDSHITNTTITATELTGAPQWDNAEVVIRKNRWTIDRSAITDHTGTTLTYTSGSSYSAINNFGFFIQRSLLTLTATGEWYHDDTADKFYMYFADDTPTNYVVKASTVEKTFYNYRYDYIGINRVTLIGANYIGIHNYMSNYSIIDSCEIKTNGGFGIYGQTDRYATITYTDIDSCSNYGIYYDINAYNATIRYCTVTNIGLFDGMGRTAGGHLVGINGGGSTNNTIENCVVRNIGYNGIVYCGYGSNGVVQHNIIDNYCLTADDGAGIYSVVASNTTGTNNLVKENIIINGIGNGGGTNTSTAITTVGIYLDDNVENVELNGNVIGNINNYGVFLHNASNSEIINNVVYNAKNKILRISCDGSTTAVANDSICNNVFVAKDATTIVYDIYDRLHNAALNFIDTSDFNYVARPIDDDYVFSVSQPDYTATLTMAQWRSYTSQDANSISSPISVADTADIDFYYNATSAPVVKSLPYASIDLAGTKYATEYTVPAYGGVVLLKDPDPDADPPDAPTVTTSVVIQLSTSTASGGGTVSDAGTISARGICWNTTGSPTTADSKTTDGTGAGAFTSTMTGLARNTTYYIRAYATNEIATSYGYEVTYDTRARSGFKSGKHLFIQGKRAVIY